MRINIGMRLAFGIHCLITITLFMDQETFMMGFVGLAIVIANFIGLLLINSNMQLAGYKTFIISSIFLFPIGLIGIIYAKKELDRLKKEKFIESQEM